MAALVAMVLATSTAVAAESKGSNQAAEKGKVTPAAEGVAQLGLAGELATYGRETRNPMALIVAAEMVAGAGAQDKARTKTTEGKGVAGADKEAKPDLSTAALLDEARGLAGQNAALLAAIDRVGASESKGRANGPGQVSERVLAGDYDLYTVRFNGGEEAAVLVVGDGDTDLDLYVYDENDNLVCDDTDSTDTMLCQWTPAWTGNFTVKIKNLGSVYNAYEMVTN